MIFIYDEILKSIKLSDKERNKLLEFSNNLMNIILDYAESKDIDVECKLVGSLAKKTSLINKADIDIFMSFPLSYDEELLKEYGLMLGEYCIEKAGGKAEKRYASHPYMTGIIDDEEIDFVPCYRIKDSSQLKSAVDRTILHTDYVTSHITDKQADEVLLLKKFMSCINTYGANYKVSGFSGYLCELLILEYHSFDNVIEAASTKWHDKFIIDLEDYGTSHKFNTSMIAIDPVDKNRNVAAALSTQKFFEFITAARNFMENPSKEYFNNPQVCTDTKGLKYEFTKRNTTTLVLSFNVPELPTDVIYPQVNKTMTSLINYSNHYHFNIIDGKYYIDSENSAHILLEYEIGQLPNIEVHHGPLIQDNKNSIKFKKKYPHAYVDNKRWASINKRKYTNVYDMIECILKEENINQIKLGKDVKEEILDKYSLMDINDYIDAMQNEEYEEIYEYLNPNYRLYRKD